MENKNTLLQPKKNFTVLLHIIFIIMSVTGITFIYMNSDFGKGLKWIYNEAYEDTPVFAEQVQSDINQIFNYVNYKDVFETNGELDFSKPVVSINDGPGRDKSYTLDEMIRYAKTRGYFLNDKYKISGSPSSFKNSEKNEVLVVYRAYQPNIQYSEPGDAYCTLEELSLEVLSCLGNYYSTYQLFINNPSNLKFRIYYEDNASDEVTMYTNSFEEEIKDLKQLGSYIYISGDSITIESNMDSLPKNITPLLESYNPYDNNNYYMIVAIDTTYSYKDAYYYEDLEYKTSRDFVMMGLILLISGLSGCIITMYCLVLISGRKAKSDTEVTLRRVDKISLETSLLFTFLAALLALYIGKKTGYRLIHLIISKNYWGYTEKLQDACIIYCVCMIEGFSLLRRYKAGTLWSGSMLRRFSLCCSQYMESHTFTTRLFWGFLSFLIFNTAAVGWIVALCLAGPLLINRVLAGSLLLLWLIVNGWIFHRIYANAYQKDQINEAIFKIASGETEYSIDISCFTGKEKILAENVNNISSGLGTALQEQVKSERLKADLITNVSHDIKTPLTSIINYVGLIKRENIQDEKILGYLEVLDQKSQRLKTLTEDLVEASKASSGNLTLEISSINFTELVEQTAGEFAEKFSLRHLELVTNHPDEAIIIEADGRRLWRILENLYNNSFKYSMEHSRVYVDITHEEDQAVFTIKNISETPLNITSDELTERFVRGDVSRSTEGSGLGLSIAKSLTELQNGNFQIIIDGDLFKVRISFCIKQKISEEGC